MLRRIYLFSEVNDAIAQSIITQLHTFESQDTEKPIELIINSAGGAFTSGLAIVDVIQSIAPPVHTTALGMCYSSAVTILAAGEPGHRVVHPNTRLMIHQVTNTCTRPASTTVSTAAGMSDAIKLQQILAEEVKVSNDILVANLAKLTRQPKGTVKDDLVNDKYMSATEAVNYGLADLVQAPKPKPTKKRKAPAIRGG